jgi:sulfatase modifying factor 1
MAATADGNRHVSQVFHAHTFWVMLVVATALGALGCRAGSSQSQTTDPGITWVDVDAGTFTMSADATGRPVSVDRFLMSATEVTFDQYDAFCDATGKQKPDDNGWGRGTRPVLNVSYDDALEFCQWLSKVTGSAVRLPYEAEWEYAARGGGHSRGYIYSGSDNGDEVSWNEHNSGNQTHPVGTKRPNELGLFDMSGNLWEWCADWPDTNSSELPSPSGVVKHAVRGNSFDNAASRTGYKSAVRVDKDSRHINIGFRVARSG